MAYLQKKDLFPQLKNSDIFYNNPADSKIN